MRIPQLVVPAPAAWGKLRDRGLVTSPDCPSPVTARDTRAEEGEGPSSVSGPEQTKKLDGLRRASVQFEALLYKEMLHAMVQGSTQGGFFGEGVGTETWQGLFESSMSDTLAGKGGLGMAEQIYRQFEAATKAQMTETPDPTLAKSPPDSI